MSLPSRTHPALACCLVALVSSFAAGCSTPQPKLGLGGLGGVYAANGPTSGVEYFSADALGVDASPRVTASAYVPRGGGRDQIGKPYTVNGKTYYPTATPKKKQTGLASWYGAAFHGRLTANGEVYDMAHLTAAHKTFPLPSYARVTNLENGRSLIVRVNDRGPFSDDRIIDLSKRAADLLGYSRSGTAQVQVEYAGRAPLHGQDDAFLLASVKGVPADAWSSGETRLAMQSEPSGVAGALSGGTSFLASALGLRKPRNPVATPVEPLGDVGVSAYATQRVASAFSGDPFAGLNATPWKKQ